MIRNQNQSKHQGPQGYKRTRLRPVLSLFAKPLLFLSILLIVSACTGSPSDPIPTRAPAPTFTPTQPVQEATVDPALVQTAQAVATEQATEQPAQPPVADNPTPAPPPAQGDQATPTVASQPTPTTEPPTNTPPPANPQVVVSNGINVRGGPGTNYAIIGAATAGQSFPVTGKNQAGDWWQINFNGQTGWVFGQLVTAQNTQAVAIAQNIPAPPPPTNTPVPPPPTNTPVPVAQAPTQAPPPPASNFQFQLLNTESCAPNAGISYVNGFVRYKSNALRNAVCVHLDMYGPRTTKCSGCDGVGDGIWGFSPFGGSPAPAGTTLEVWIVGCPGSMPLGGQNDNFGDLTPLSPKWKHTFSQSEQCTGITFVGD
ncbi:MAG: SH3 domain-containing protein [Caldilineaceae bacterium]